MHVLLTGTTGFIAKRIALDLLDAGHRVRGSLRSPGRAEEVRNAIAPKLADASVLDRLTFVTLDLTKDDGWPEAMDGVDALVHTASPFPMTQPKNDEDLIRPAVDGTLRALRAAEAAGVTRVVMTSSVVAIEAQDDPMPWSEANWTDPGHPRATAYYQSKTLAERAAWDFVAEHPQIRLTTINPALVLGEPLDPHTGTSLGLVERVLGGKDPMVPDIGFGVVDVADVSAMHVRALTTPEAEGKRFIASAGTMTMPQMARHLKAAHPDRKIATGVAPKWLLRLLSLADPSIRTVLPGIGVYPTFDNTQARSVLGIDFTPAETALDRAAAAILSREGDVARKAA
ncbi:NAD-dependent epimerase/dehydratase family protein [Rhodobacterales bacterium HKCCE3408]|nr:NAD-dependent epimerase/dehydratase family protein [Rhodobacterales bacterium HKCCE3408]